MSNLTKHNPFFIGSSSLLKEFEKFYYDKVDHNVSYPPYDIVQKDENNFLVSLAVAGFKPEDIDIQENNGYLTIIGQVTSENSTEEVTYLHRGISTRKFERTFKLAEHVHVVDATIDNGMLHVSLEREVPEELKPRKITIASKS